MADPKASFLGSISPWNVSRDASPRPQGDATGPAQGREHLKRSSGQDHTVRVRPLPSPSRYPSDCPPLRARWYYAVDVPKRKPLWVEQKEVEKPKTSPGPQKFTPFSARDSAAIETAFQKLADRDDSVAGAEEAQTLTKVPVNEDHLFDVVIEKRELEPAYWLGPVYEVGRGSWFYPEGSKFRPCEENLANQLEEGYLKTTPWRDLPGSGRSRSQPRSRPSTAVIEDAQRSAGSEGTSPVDGISPKIVAADAQTTDQMRSYRLFGAHMNKSVSYQDATTAWLVNDDFVSRMSNTFVGRGTRLGAFSGTKVVRGFRESNTKMTEVLKTSGSDTDVVKDKRGSREVKTDEDAPREIEAPPRKSALERQLSSLAGGLEQNSPEDLAEEVRQEQEMEMEDYKEQDGVDSGRPIDHLVLVTHGIGQRLGLRLDSINFIHDVNTLRKTLKAVYASAPDLQALNSQAKDSSSNSRVLCLPIVWRHLLDFPRQSLRDNRRELDLSEADVIDEEQYPSLQDITLDGVPSVRNLITDLAMDVLLYQSAYREHIARLVQRECNRVFRLFKERNPEFDGKVSLCGHSLGSAIYFDILCRQKDELASRIPTLNKTSTDMVREQGSLQLDFECENLFALGSPIALFQMLKGRTICARKPTNYRGALSPFDPDPMENTMEDAQEQSQSRSVIPISASSPKCGQLFNIFHPTDPISYRMEPLISPAMAALKPQLLPYTKKGLFGAPGIANIGARVGQSVGSMWYSFTSGVASSLLNRSLGITGDEQVLNQDKFQGNMDKTNKIHPRSGPEMPIADGERQRELAQATLAGSSQTGNAADHLPTLIDSELETLYAGFEKRRLSQQSRSQNPLEEGRHADDKAKKLKREEAKVLALNRNGRVDYSIQEGTFDISLLASIASHLSYWADEDVNHFMAGQILSRSNSSGDKVDRER